MNDNTVLQLWYQGAGEIYRKNYGLPGIQGTLWSRLNDNPQQRMLGYLIYSTIFILTSIIVIIGSIIVLSKANEMQRLIIGTTMLPISILALLLLFYSCYTLFVWRKVKTAVSQNQHPDLSDSLRMKTLRRAINRLQQEGIITLTQNNQWEVNQNERSTT